MDWYSVDRRLATLFRGAPRQAGAGYWIPAAEPIALAPLLDEALTTEDERDEYEGTFYEWPGQVAAVLAASDAFQHSILSCEWSFAPGGGSADGLDVIGTAARSYLCYWCDWGDGYAAVACLQPGDDAGVLDDVVERALLSNGGDFGISIWGSPPSEYSSSVSEQLMHRAFDAMRERDDFGEWHAYVANGYSYEGGSW